MGFISWQESLSEFRHNSAKPIYPDLIAKGNQLFYRDSLIRNIDPEFLSSLGYGYFKYKKCICYFDRGSFKLLPKADVATFKTTLSLTYDKKYVYKGADPILKSKKIELLAILAGPEEGGDEGMLYIDYLIYKNYKGYWVKRSYEPHVRYLGKSIKQQFIEIPKEIVSENTKTDQ